MRDLVKRFQNAILYCDHLRPVEKNLACHLLKYTIIGQEIPSNAQICKELNMNRGRFKDYFQVLYNKSIILNTKERRLKLDWACSTCWNTDDYYADILNLKYETINARKESSDKLKKLAEKTQKDSDDDDW